MQDPHTKYIEDNCITVTTYNITELELRLQNKNEYF